MLYELDHVLTTTNLREPLSVQTHENPGHLV
jgi:hypothetical protein